MVLGTPDHEELLGVVGHVDLDTVSINIICTDVVSEGCSNLFCILCLAFHNCGPTAIYVNNHKVIPAGIVRAELGSQGWGA